MSNNFEDEQDSQELIPTEQDTITFQGKSLVVVRLSDGRNGVVLRWICENLQLLPAAQVRRIKRTEVIADDLVYVQVQTDGGPQIMPTLVLHAVPSNGPSWGRTSDQPIRTAYHLFLHRANPQ